MGESFNENFSSVYAEVRIKDAKETSGDVLDHVHITREEVFATLDRIKVDKSPVPDQVLSQTLWEARKEKAEALADIFTSSLATGEILEDWRLANVVPWFKKDSKDKLGNYRPVRGLDQMARGDLIEVYKIMRGKDRVNAYSPLPRDGELKTREHRFK
eukprot:g29088.t1